MSEDKGFHKLGLHMPDGVPCAGCVTLDGEELKGVMGLTLELKPDKVVTAHIDLFVSIDQEIFAKLDIQTHDPERDFLRSEVERLLQRVKELEPLAVQETF